MKWTNNEIALGISTLGKVPLTAKVAVGGRHESQP